MSLLLYLAVLLVSVSSVLFGLGWLSPPEPRYAAPPAQVASHAPAKPAATKTDGQATFGPVDPTAPGAAQAAKPAVAASPPPQPVAAAQSVAAPAADQADAARNAEAAAPPAPIAAAPPACDVQACTRAYRSFRVSDCTWQPYEGPRRFCDKGTPPARAQATPDAVAAPSGVDAQAQAARAQASSCNVTACAAAYRTFNPADCTYQPLEGPRRICSK
jgi:hypothetical protein